jgi:hypothetical protein
MMLINNANITSIQAQAQAPTQQQSTPAINTSVVGPSSSSWVILFKY